MKYKVGDFVEIEVPVKMIGKIVNIENGGFIVRVRHGYIMKFKKNEIGKVVNYKGVMK